MSERISFVEMLKRTDEMDKAKRNISPEQKLDALRAELAATQKSINKLIQEAPELSKVIKPGENDFDYQSAVEHISGYLERKRNILLESELELIQDWQERGIPLTVVLSAINRHRDQLKSQRRRLTSLIVCQEEVETAYYYYCEFTEKVSFAQTHDADE